MQREDSVSVESQSDYVCVFLVCVCRLGGGPVVGSVPSQPDSLSQSATHGARFG